jgi:hypothetical protein
MGDFVICAFSSKLPGSKTLLDWPQPNELTVTVQLPGRGALSSALRARKLRGFPAGGAKVQEAVANLADQQRGDIPDFTLYTVKQGKKTTLTWTVDSETPALAGLRSLLEGIGHLRCLEALAYWEFGHDLGGNGVFPAALRLLRAGIGQLGDGYRTAGLRDDTGTQLVIAEHHEQMDDLEPAWDICSRVLRSRISIYERRHGLQLGWKGSKTGKA